MTEEEIKKQEEELLKRAQEQYSNVNKKAGEAKIELMYTTITKAFSKVATMDESRRVLKSKEASFNNIKKVDEIFKFINTKVDRNKTAQASAFKKKDNDKLAKVTEVYERMNEVEAKREAVEARLNDPNLHLGGLSIRLLEAKLEHLRQAEAKVASKIVRDVLKSTVKEKAAYRVAAPIKVPMKFLSNIKDIAITFFKGQEYLNESKLEKAIETAEQEEFEDYIQEVSSEKPMTPSAEFNPKIESETEELPKGFEGLVGNNPQKEEENTFDEFMKIIKDNKPVEKRREPNEMDEFLKNNPEDFMRKLQEDLQRSDEPKTVADKEEKLDDPVKTEESKETDQKTGTPLDEAMEKIRQTVEDKVVSKPVSTSPVNKDIKDIIAERDLVKVRSNVIENQNNNLNQTNQDLNSRMQAMYLKAQEEKAKEDQARIEAEREQLLSAKEELARKEQENHAIKEQVAKTQENVNAVEAMLQSGDYAKVLEYMEQNNIVPGTKQTEGVIQLPATNDMNTGSTKR